MIKKEIAVSQREVQRYEKLQSQTDITAKILKRHVNVGSWVSPGTPLLEIFDLQKIAVELAIPASHFHQDIANSKVVLRLCEAGASYGRGK